MWPVLAAAFHGFAKGFGGPKGEVVRFRAEQDVFGPIREELIYRGAPLWAFPRAAFGSTAAVFAADHIVSDMRVAAKAQQAMTPRDIVARFGDVLLGGLIYERAFKQYGIIGAVSAHAAHNVFIGLGSRARNRFR